MDEQPQVRMFPIFSVEAPGANPENPNAPTEYVFSDSTHDHVKVKTLCALVEIEGEVSAMWRSAGNQGSIIQMLASLFLQNAGMFEAVGAMMQYLATLHRAQMHAQQHGTLQG